MCISGERAAGRSVFDHIHEEPFHNEHTECLYKQCCAVQSIISSIGFVSLEGFDKTAPKI